MHRPAFPEPDMELPAQQKTPGYNDPRAQRDAMKVSTDHDAHETANAECTIKGNDASTSGLRMSLRFTVTTPVEPTALGDHAEFLTNEHPTTQTTITMTGETLTLLDCALCSLYEDQIFPTFSALRPRLRDFKLPRDVQDHFMSIYGHLPAYIVDAHVEPPAILFAHDPEWFTNWVEPTSKEDPYPASLWQGFADVLQTLHERYISSHDDDEWSLMVYRGRYGLAQDLVARKLPFFEGVTLGQMSHIVELAIGKKLLAYENNKLLPASRCLSHTNAQLGKPTLRTIPIHHDFSPTVQPALSNSATKVGKPERRSEELPYVEDINELRQYVFELLCIHCPQGFSLSALKMKIRQRFNKNLSETIFGETRLLDLVRRKCLEDVCVVEKVHSGCAYFLKARHGANRGIVTTPLFFQ